MVVTSPAPSVPMTSSRAKTCGSSHATISSTQSVSTLGLSMCPALVPFGKSLHNQGLLYRQPLSDNIETNKTTNKPPSLAASTSTHPNPRRMPRRARMPTRRTQTPQPTTPQPQQPPAPKVTDTPTV
jgi:hypothetical protein